jgi:hypothetical protein
VGEAAARLNPAVALDAFFEHDFRRRPVQATFTGIHDHDDRLPDWSRDGLDAAVCEMKTDRATLSHDQVDVALAGGHLEIQMAEHESGHFVHANPALWTGEAIFAVIALVTRDYAPLERRLAAAAARMHAIPDFLRQARDVLTAAPDAWRRRALREADAAIRLFGECLPPWFARAPVPDSLVDDAQAAAAAARTGFAQFHDWLSRDVPAAPPSRVSAGQELLDLLLRRGHWCLTPIETLLAEARDALEDAIARLARCSRRIAPGGWAEAQECLANEHPSAAGYLQRFSDVWQAAHDAAAAHDLVTWPDAPIRYVPMPEHTREVAPHLYYLFYRSPAPFDRLPVHDYVVTPVTADLTDEERTRRLRANNDSVIKLNHVVHHGGLGHHVQNHHAYAGASRVGRVAAVDGASRIGMFCGGSMAEGWACYACDVMEDVGFLTPLDAVAQQHTRVRLLVRAVADLELHSGRSTFEQTMAMYRERAFMPAEAAEKEAARTSMFPGTAVMYWLGTRGLHDLRRDVAAREGAAFVLRQFHDRVLSCGSIPVALVARLMLEETGA